MRTHEYHRDGNTSFVTTSLFWDCSCETNYIHRASVDTCPRCGDTRDESPDSRVDEIVANANDLELSVVSLNGRDTLIVRAHIERNAQEGRYA